MIQTGLWSTSALAQDKTTTTPETSETEVIVTGRRFLDQDTSGTTNLPLALEKVPQAITLVNEDFIDAADIRTLGEIAQYSSGAFLAGAIGGSVSLVKLRGFTAGYAVDGLTVGAFLAEPDNATVERFEIVKGPSSVVYGAAPPGGLVNLVLKGARANTPSYVSVLGGSYNRFRAEGQVAGALNKAGTIRAIGVGAYERSDSFLDFFKLNKWVAYGGLDVDVADNVTLYVRAAHEYVARPGFDGIPAFATGALPDVPRSRYIGPKDRRVVSKTNRGDIGLNWDITSAWSFNLKANYQRTNHDGAAPYGYALQPNGNFLIQTRFLDFRLNDWNVGASTVYKFDDLGLRDSFFAASAIYQHSDRRQLTFFPTINGASIVTSNIFNSSRAIADLIDTQVLPGTRTSLNEQRLKYLTLSAQAVVKIADPVTLLGGFSYSMPEVRSRTVGNGAFLNFDPKNQMSYRAAITVEPVTGLNIYGSYSESFQPQFRTDINDRVIDPTSGTQYELGTKYISPDRRLILTAAVFRLQQANQAVVAGVGSNGLNFFAAVGKVRHRGVELEAIGQITSAWQVNASFTHLDAKVRADAIVANVGKTRPFLPKNTASLFTTYDFAGGFFASAGGRYVDAVKTSFGTTRKLPSYTLVDAALGYGRDNWRIQLNVKNILDEAYYSNNFETLLFANQVGEPRTFAVSARLGF